MLFYDFKLCIFEQQLLLSCRIEGDGGFLVGSRTFDTDHPAPSETLVKDYGVGLKGMGCAAACGRNGRMAYAGERAQGARLTEGHAWRHRRLRGCTAYTALGIAVEILRVDFT